MSSSQQEQQGCVQPGCVEDGFMTADELYDRSVISAGERARRNHIYAREKAQAVAAGSDSSFSGVCKLIHFFY